MNRESILKLLITARKRGTDKQFCAWIRILPCCLCNPQGHPQITRTEAAHVSRAAERGIGKKSEYACIPLCAACHRAQHQNGEQAVLKKIGMTLSVIAAKEYFDKLRIEYLKEWING